MERCGCQLADDCHLHAAARALQDAASNLISSVYPGSQTLEDVPQRLVAALTRLRDAYKQSRGRGRPEETAPFRRR